MYPGLRIYYPEFGLLNRADTVPEQRDESVGKDGKLRVHAPRSFVISPVVSCPLSGSGVGVGRALEARASRADQFPLSLGASRAAAARLVHAMKTYTAKPTDRDRNWLIVDATGQTLGRLATQIADTLRGKRKPTYTPHIDTGDFVVVVNAEKIRVTGNKLADKRYYRHSGYPGGLKSRTLQEMLDRRPEEVIRLAVKGMLPRNRIARKQLTKLKVYAGPDHPHAAQQPQPMETHQ